MANPFAQIVNTVGTLAAGHIVLATEWNTAVGGMYTYINSTLLAGGLNKMATKGDLYVFDGANLQVISTGGAGNDGKVLVLDSAQTLGVKYATLANTAQLTTKGDLLGYTTTNARVPVGANGSILTADSTQTTGVAWTVPATQFPLGGIMLWDLSQRAMPGNFNLCDGGTYSGYLTPNTQGLYLAGAGLSNNPPAASGMGAIVCGTIAGDTSAGSGLGPAHTHTISYAAVPSGLTTLNGNYTLNNSNATITPRYIALAFIMRTS